MKYEFVSEFDMSHSKWDNEERLGTIVYNLVRLKCPERLGMSSVEVRETKVIGKLELGSREVNDHCDSYLAPIIFLVS